TMLSIAFWSDRVRQSEPFSAFTQAAPNRLLAACRQASETICPAATALAWHLRRSATFFEAAASFCAVHLLRPWAGTVLVVVLVVDVVVVVAPGGRLVGSAGSLPASSSS